MKMFFGLIVIVAALFCSSSSANFAIFMASNNAPSYEGLASTRARVNSIPNVNFDTTNKQLMTRSAHIARSNLTDLKIIASNFYVAQGQSENGSGATASISASVEYPSGTCTQILFSAVSSGSITNGSTLTSDYLPINIPTGATYWIRQFWQSSGGAIYNPSNFVNLMSGEATRVAVSGLSDQTLTCDTVTDSGVGMHYPLAIISHTIAPTLCIVGDSIAWGANFDTGTASGDSGMIERTIGPSYGYSNVAVPSDRAGLFVASSTQRKKVFPYCSHAIVEYGSNDLNSFQSVQLPGNLNTIYASFSTQTVFQTTILPRPSTTDACATLGNQTAWFAESERIAFNDSLKAGSFGPNGGQFDTSSATETGTDSGFWKTSPQKWSPECIHPNTFGAGQIYESGMIDLTRIHRP